jgi:hypothetical protein
MEIALIINEMNNEGILETTPTGNIDQLHCRCLLTNETTTCLQIEHENPLGMRTPYPDIWKSCHKPESREPDEDKSTNRLCACGEEFQSEQEIDAHCAANVTSGAHGCTSDRLEKIGGAHLWMDPNTGEVLQAKTYPLPHQGLGPVSSTRYEAATVVQATLGLIALCETADTQRNPEHPIKEATLSTDSQGSVDAYESQVLKFTTAPKKSKSPLQDHMHNMKATSGTLQRRFRTLLILTHKHNEHSRKWDNEARDDLACRANQACDRAAKKAAAVQDLRFQNHGAGHGGRAFLAKNGSAIHSDIKDIITETRTQMLMKITSTPEKDSSTGNDDPAPTQPETEAQDMARA